MTHSWHWSSAHLGVGDEVLVNAKAALAGACERRGNGDEGQVEPAHGAAVSE